MLCQEKPLLVSAADGCQQLPMVSVAFKLRPHRAPLLLPLETTSQSGRWCQFSRCYHFRVYLMFTWSVRVTDVNGIAQQYWPPLLCLAWADCHSSSAQFK